MHKITVVSNCLSICMYNSFYEHTTCVATCTNPGVCSLYDSSAHQSVVRVNPAVGGALGGAVGRVPARQHAAVVTLLAHTATTAAPGIAAVVTI